MADAISAYVRGTIFLPGTPPFPIATLNFYQAWDNSGKGPFAFPPPLRMDAYTELVCPQRSTPSSIWINPIATSRLKFSGSR